MMVNKIKNFLKTDPELIDINPEQESLRKVLYWRVISVIISLLVAYYYLGELYDSIEMTVVEAAILTLLHYIFEETWTKDKH
jgi:uncharacterized membrane protein